MGDASGPGSSPPVEPASGLAAPHSIPIADIPRFLECFDILGRFEAHHTVIRHYGAFNPQEWPDRPDLSVMRVIRWLKSLAQGIDRRAASETAQQARPEGPESGGGAMRPDDTVSPTCRIAGCRHARSEEDMRDATEEIARLKARLEELEGKLRGDA